MVYQYHASFVLLSFEVLERELKVVPDTDLGKKKWVILEHVQLVEIVDLITQGSGDVINVGVFTVTDAILQAVLAVEKVI